MSLARPLRTIALGVVLGMAAAPAAIAEQPQRPAEGEVVGGVGVAGEANGPATDGANGPVQGEAASPATGEATGPATGEAAGPATGEATGPAAGEANGLAQGEANGSATGGANGSAKVQPEGRASGAAKSASTDAEVLEQEAKTQARKDALAAEKQKKWIERHGPRRKSWEFGLYGGVATPSRGLDLRADSVPWQRYNRVAGDVGLRFGYYFLRLFGLEGEFGLLPAQTAASRVGALIYAGRIQPVVQVPLWRITPFGALGVGLLGVSSDPTAMGNDVDFLFSYGGGVKVYVSRNVGLRLDVRTNLSQKYLDPDAADSEEFLLGLVVRLGPKLTPVPRPPSDRDEDGFVDEVDACPDEPGVAPDGCPIPDTDGDGFLDPKDACVEEPGVAPDGCPIPDTDGDGFLDPADACVEEPGVEPDGCPVRDTDGDGIFDDVDQCVNEPETFNQFEDDDGCPDQIPAEVEEFTGAIEGIYFETGRAEIRKKSHVALEAAAKVLGDYPDLKVEISGHTDGRGKRQFNMTLSADRAAAVKDWLVGHGIDGARITTRGAGPDEPVADNGTKKGRAQNRRIEFRLIQ